MSCFNISQEKLNNASYEDLSWLMESIHNTYKIKDCAWEKADKEYLQAKCEEWELSPKGKKDALIVALQQAQTDYEYAQLYSTKPNIKPKKEKAEKPKKEKAEKPKKEKVETKVDTKQKTKKSDDESVPEWAKGKTVADLKEICKEKQIKGASGKNKAQIIKLIEEAGKAQLLKTINAAMKAAKEEPPKEESSSDSDSDSESEPEEEPEEEQKESYDDIKRKLDKLKRAGKAGIDMPCTDTLPSHFWEGKWMDGEGTGAIRFKEGGCVIGMVGDAEDPYDPWIKTGIYKAQDYEVSELSDSESDSDDSEDDDKEGDWEYDEDNEQWVHSVTGQIKWCDEKPE